MNLKPLIISFINYMDVEKGCSKNTTSLYKVNLRDFENFIQTKDIQSLEDVNRELIVSFLSSFKEKGAAASTIRSKLSALRSFFKFLKREKEIKKNILAGIDLPKLPLILPDILTVKECKQLLETTHITHGKWGRTRFRDVAILELLYGSGLRSSELCNAKIRDLNLETQTLKIINGKGRKGRIVPVTKKFIEKLQRYWNKHRNHSNLNPDDYIFLNKEGRPVTRFSIWWMIKRHGKTCGIEKNIYPHLMRHNCASHLVQGGADIRIVQDILGHADIGTTGIYLNFDTKYLSEAFKNSHHRYPQKKNFKKPIEKEYQEKVSRTRKEEARLRASNRFFERVKKVHGDKYDLSKVEYVWAKEKVVVICRRHGEFRITAGSFVFGSGCSQCGLEKQSKKHKCG